MADQAVNEMISAFSAGCMDKENLTQFIQYMKHKGELPYKELGKMQTLVSMLPVILEREHPSTDLKNKVARALIAMQDEIKEKIKTDRQKTIEVRPAKQPEPEKPKIELEEEIVIKKHADVSPVLEAVQEPVVNVPKPPVPEEAYLNQNRLFTEIPPRILEGPSLTPVWIVVALLFIAIGVFAYLFYSSNAVLKESIARTESSIVALKGELRGTSDYINRNSALVDFFSNDNVWMVPLTGSDPALKITGKLYIAPNDKEALLQISNLPTPSPENIYQLWLVTKQQTYSVGNFFIEPSSRFVKMTNLPQIPKEQIERFQITLEPRSGSPLPSGIIYAYGNVNETGAKPVRRK
jgi:hypothetical protein